MGTRNVLVDRLMSLMSSLHRAVLHATGWRIGRSLGSMPVVELHTRGRTTGKRRSVVLAAPVHGDGRYLLVASKGGDDRHPAWYLNLVANPEIELTVDGTTMKMRARTASADEKAELWPKIVAAYRGYDGYQHKTQRDIPVVICDPR